MLDPRRNPPTGVGPKLRFDHPTRGKEEFGTRYTRALGPSVLGADLPRGSRHPAISAPQRSWGWRPSMLDQPPVSWGRGLDVGRMSCGARLRKDVFARNVTFDPTGPSGDGRRLWGRFDRESASTMDEYTARARKVYGGWEVTVAGMPDATFIHREPTDELTHEKLAAVLDRSDFRVSLVRDSEGLAPPVFSSPPRHGDFGPVRCSRDPVHASGETRPFGRLDRRTGLHWSRMPGTVRVWVTVDWWRCPGEVRTTA